MLYWTVFVLLMLTQQTLNVVIIQNPSYRCRCVPPGNCDDDELSYVKKSNSHRREEEYYDRDYDDEDDLDSYIHGDLHPRMLQSAEECEGGTEECCGAIKPPVTYIPPKSLFRQKHKCGIRKVTRNTPHVSTRITKNSQKAFLGELPWNLLILDSHRKENDTSYRCGASLIHPKAALTASHCVETFQGNEHQIVVRAGEWDLSNENEPYKFQESGVEEILIHPQYIKESLKNDIALVFLTKAFTMEMNIGTICLARTDLPRRCTVSGWGKNAYKVGIYSQILKTVEVPIVHREICARKLREIAPGKRFNLHRSFICAGGERHKDACKGDGGSPMVCWVHAHGRFVQTGIVSWGVECGREIPGIYVNVVLYLEWIDQSMLSRGLEVSYYKIDS